MNYFQDFYNGFNQLTQLVFGFALGLAFSQSNITVGWIFFWIVVWEFGVYLFLGRTKYYDPFFRIAYNCVFLLSILVGQYIYFGKTTFQDFLYSNSPKNKKSFSGEKYQIMDQFEKFLDELLNGEEKREKRKKLIKRYKLFSSP
jgi:hypothetical protein